MIYHILNGDALDHQLPDQLNGERIIMRECLMEGPVKADSFDAFVRLRSDFVSKTFGDPHYEDQVIPELQKIQRIEDKSQVFLWFEDDLFCQVNLWYVMHQLVNKSSLKIHLVRPSIESPYGFGYYDSEGLIPLFEQSTLITQLDVLASLWTHYQNEDWELLVQSAQALTHTFPFIASAVDAQVARIPDDHSEGRPLETLRTIVAEMGSDNFKDIFSAFTNREAIYGMGDLQVKNMLKKLIKNKTE
jgi:hypothetical protein